MSETKGAFLGCVADDVTGATDLAINLVKGGMRVVQLMCVPTQQQLENLECDAIVVALKTRSLPAQEAVDQSLAAVDALRLSGCQRFYFKYCSTFDSTTEGNIGPVAAAMLDRLDVQSAIVCPSFPAAGRTVYLGHLFVNGELLNESGMQHHPLNPMTDSNIVRFLGQQTDRAVGLVAAPDVVAGVESTTRAIDRALSDGCQLLVTDTCQDSDLATIAGAIVDHQVITGGSGIGRYLPDAWRKKGLIGNKVHQPKLPQIEGNALIIAGSCSEMTRRQVAFMKDRSHCFQVDVGLLMQDFEHQISEFESAIAKLDDRPLMIYSTDAPEKIAPIHKEHGRAKVCQTVEQFHGRVAKWLVEEIGFRKIIVAGGETSGSVMRELEIQQLQIGPEICTGVPWTFTLGENRIAVALKSGNFGGEDFFESALKMFE